MLLYEIYLTEDDLARSFASLVKYNNGMFKSEKQARFLLSQCDGPEGNKSYTTGGNVWGNSFSLEYHCDDTGVTHVEKYTPKSGKTETTWERKVAGKKTVGEEKAIKQIRREIKKVEKAIKEREVAKDDYKDAMDLYNSSMQRDVEHLNGLKTRLQEIESGI